MKLYASVTSPYSRLAAIAALRGGYRSMTLEFVLPWKTPADFTDINPFCQVPALLCDDGSLLTETLIICQYLDPRFIQGGADSAQLSYGMGIINQAVRYMSLKIIQTDTAEHPMMARSIAMLKTALPRAAALNPDSSGWGHIVLGSALNYVRMRLPDLYEQAVSRADRDAAEKFCQRDFMVKTESARFEALPKTIGDL